MTGAGETLRILFVEDVQTDAELIWKEISKNGISFEKVLVETRNDYMEALQNFHPHIIISDYSLPQFDGSAALELRNRIDPILPFILVTGSVNEEIAVAMMKAGADDYVLKHNMSRLGEAIRTALERKEAMIRKEAVEEALKESEERFRMLFDKAPVGYQSLNADGYFLEVNETWISLLGYQREEVIGRWFGDFLTPQSADMFRTLFKQFMVDGKGYAEFRMIKKNGDVIIVAIDGKIARSPDGNVIQTHCVLDDITELKIAQETLRESEERFRKAVTEAPVPIMIHDEDGNVLLLSKGWTDYSGYTLEDIPTVGDWTEKAYGDRQDSEKANIGRLFSINKTTDNGEHTICARNGDMRIWDFQTTPLGRVSRGKRVLHSLAVDITEMKKSQEELKRKIQELELFNDLTVDREIKMVELKKEINSLLLRLGETERWKSV